MGDSGRVVEVQPPGRRRISRVAITLVIASVLMGAAAGARIGIAFAGVLNQPAATVPGTITYPVGDPGTYAIFTRTGTQRGSQSFTVTVNLGSRVHPADVTITGPGGENIPALPVGGNETLTRDGEIYTASVEFRATAGDHTIEVAGTEEHSVVVARELADQIKALLAVVLAGFLFVGSLIALIVSAVRAGRANRALSGPA